MLLISKVYVFVFMNVPPFRLRNLAFKNALGTRFTPLITGVEGARLAAVGTVPTEVKLAVVLKTFDIVN